MRPVLLVVSYAGIRAINRAVYSRIQNDFEVVMAVPQEAIASSGIVISLEPSVEGEGRLIGHRLKGRSPRTMSFMVLNKTLRDIRPQVVLYEGDPASWLAWQLARWTKRHNARLICQTYDNVDRRWSASAGRPWIGRLINLVISIVNMLMIDSLHALLVVNRAGEVAFANLGYRRIVRIPLGYDPGIFYSNTLLKEGMRNQLAIQPDEVVVGYFGRMVEQKGVHLLIRALAQLQDLNWRFLLDENFDPENSYSHEIRSLISFHHLQNRVMCFKASHEGIADYMRAADISVAPSLATATFTEQYGRAVQEAMACGCAVIVSDSGHLPDLVNDSELVFPENSLDGLIIVLRRAIIQKQWREQKSLQLQRRAMGSLKITDQAEKIIQVMSGI